MSFMIGTLYEYNGRRVINEVEVYTMKAAENCLNSCASINRQYGMSTLLNLWIRNAPVAGRQYHSEPGEI